jgi:hypothetical protein
MEGSVPRPANYRYNGPVIFTVADFEILIATDNKLFARKFDINKDSQILDLIDEKIRQGG